MTAARTWSTGHESDAFDVVGNRVLVGVQMVNISRLSTHPIPMTSHGLVTVAGQGPKDSNGAGKSSLIAAISLLHADEQWRLGGGAAGAAELLFTAELAAQEGRWSNVDWGYVIGVFADRAAETQDELAASTLTVWLRINRKASHLHLRWKQGLYVPHGSTESERAAGVDAMWDALPHSNGRTDFHANRLSTVLYGGIVRCVSFLSTSVRSSPAANLLAQPLNDLDPKRIFDAIATLTGLDRELEHEQALRSAEHQHRVDVTEAEADLSRWEQDMAVVEAGILKRGIARELLGQAQVSWQKRCARDLLDGIARAEDIQQDIKLVDNRIDELHEQLDTVESDLAGLLDAEETDRHFREVVGRWQELDGRDRQLDTAQQVAAEKIESLTAEQRVLAEQARAADGRTVENATDQETASRATVEAALADKGAADAAVKRAEKLVAAAISGQDVASAELSVLESAGIPAAALLDVLQLESDRDIWEPRLVPYRGAVVVAATDIPRAQIELAVWPGAMLIAADTVEAAAQTGLPVSADPRFPLSTFCRAIELRAGDQASEIDSAAGVLVMGSFADPLTGRTTRISAAEAELAAMTRAAADSEKVVVAARRELERATVRRAAAVDGQKAELLRQQIVELRAVNQERIEQREALEPLLDAARLEHNRALGLKQASKERIANLRGTKSRLEAEAGVAGIRKSALTEEWLGLDIAGREAAWGDSSTAAKVFVLSLPDDEQARTTAEWNAQACDQLNQASIRCFPESTPAEQMPAQIRELLVEQRWQRGTLDVRVALVTPLIRALKTHLAQTEQHDNYERQQIATQRAQRAGDFDAAQQGLQEAERTSRAHRASLAQGIKVTLKKVSDEFDRLDQQYGGYGAGLDFPEPEAPAEPDRPWRWTVTPRWRRAEGQKMSGYNLRSNTAQMDEKAVKLVCAAALAGGGDRPLLLILDELGRNLGKQHRREAVALFEQIGKDRNITVIGALQDDMERYAIEASGLYIKLRRRSDSMAYNEAPVVVGDEANRPRVQLLRDWLESYRPVPELAEALL